MGGAPGRTRRWSGSRSTASSPRSSSRRARRTAATAPRRSSTPSARRSRRGTRRPSSATPAPAATGRTQPDAAVRRALQRARRRAASRYVDKVFGEVVTPNAAQQDFVLLRSDGVPLYNFGAVVDDITMGITLVARGRDHMVNTPPQILLYEALGAAAAGVRAPADDARAERREAPQAPRRRERRPSTATRGTRRAPCSTTSSASAGRTATRRCSRSASSSRRSTGSTAARSDGKFDAKKFLAIDHEHLKTPRLTADAEYAQRMAPFLGKRGLDVGAARADGRVPLIRERAHTFVEAADPLDFFFRDPPALDAKAAAKFLVPASAPHLRGLADAIEKASPGPRPTSRLPSTRGSRAPGCQ